MLYRFLALLLLLAMPGVAHAEWHEASSAHFVVYSDDRPERLKEFATDLERFDKALRVLRGLRDDPVGDANRVVVYVVPRIADVKRLVEAGDVAGFYQPRAGGSIAVVPRRSGSGGEMDLTPQAILLHEYTHHIMLSQWPDAAYPSWFVEGYAEFHATARFRKDGSVAFGEPPQYRGYGLLTGNALPIQKLLISESLKLKDEERDALYGRGWLLTHYLTFGNRRPGQLNAYLTAINRGQGALEAATSVFGDLRTLDREIERYKGGSFEVRLVPAERIAVGEVRIRKLTPGEAATMDVRIVSKSGVDEKTAPGVYALAKKAAAPYPNDPGAQIVLAEAAYDAQDYAGAEAAADRALAADPKAVDALLYKARAKMAAAAKAGDTSKATMRAVQRLLAQANAIDSENPEPLILFYHSFFEFGERPTRNAIDAFYTTFALAPQDKGLRMSIASAYLNDGNFAMAKALLRPLAYDPHNRGLAEAAAKLIADIDSGKLGPGGNREDEGDEEDDRT